MSPFVVGWLIIVGLCALAGALLHEHDRMSGFVLGAVFGPFGIVAAAIANATATLEEIRDRLPAPASLHPPAKASVKRVFT